MKKVCLKDTRAAPGRAGLFHSSLVVPLDPDNPVPWIKAKAAPEMIWPEAQPRAQPTPYSVPGRWDVQAVGMYQSNLTSLSPEIHRGRDKETQ